MRYSMIVICAMILASIANSQTIEKPKNFNRDDVVYYGSVASLGISTMVDLHSSIGKRELNPIFRNEYGQFDTQKGLIIKSSVLFGTLAVQTIYLRKNPKRKKLVAIANFAVSGMFFAVAARNYGIKP